MALWCHCWLSVFECLRSVMFLSLSLSSLCLLRSISGHWLHLVCVSLIWSRKICICFFWCVTFFLQKINPIYRIYFNSEQCSMLNIFQYKFSPQCDRFHILAIQALFILLRYIGMVICHWRLWLNCIISVILCYCCLIAAMSRAVHIFGLFVSLCVETWFNWLMGYPCSIIVIPLEVTVRRSRKGEYMVLRKI